MNKQTNKDVKINYTYDPTRLNSTGLKGKTRDKHRNGESYFYISMQFLLACNYKRYEIAEVNSFDVKQKKT